MATAAKELDASSTCSRNSTAPINAPPAPAVSPAVRGCHFSPQGPGLFEWELCATVVLHIDNADWQRNRCRTRVSLLAPRSRSKFVRNDCSVFGFARMRDDSHDGTWIVAGAWAPLR